VRTPKDAWRRLLTAAGGQAKLARTFRKSRQAIFQWKKKIPEKRLVRIQELYGIEPWTLRPDLYREKQP